MIDESILDFFKQTERDRKLQRKILQGKQFEKLLKQSLLEVTLSKSLI